MWLLAASVTAVALVLALPLALAAIDHAHRADRAAPLVGHTEVLTGVYLRYENPGLPTNIPWYRLTLPTTAPENAGDTMEVNGREKWGVPTPPTDFPHTYDFLVHYTGHGVVVIKSGPVGTLHPVTAQQVAAARRSSSWAWGAAAAVLIAGAVAAALLSRAGIRRGRRRRAGGRRVE